jgi:hypothetical protein
MDGPAPEKRSAIHNNAAQALRQSFIAIVSCPNEFSYLLYILAGLRKMPIEKKGQL